MRTVHNLEIVKQKRKSLRNNSTPQEMILWSRLKNKTLGFKFRRQHSIGMYIVDFCCPERQLIVEIDGSQHGEESAEIYDKVRTDYLQQLGYTVLRFWNNEIKGPRSRARRFVELASVVLSRSKLSGIRPFVSSSLGRHKNFEVFAALLASRNKC